MISFDNGNTYTTSVTERGITAEELEALVEVMPDDIRERLHDRLAPCTETAFVEAYLAEPDAVDLVIG